MYAPFDDVVVSAVAVDVPVPVSVLAVVVRIVDAGNLDTVLMTLNPGSIEFVC